MLSLNKTKKALLTEGKGVAMRMIEALDFRRWFTTISSAYKKLLDKETPEGKLVLRDIVGFSKLGMYEPNTTYTAEQLIEMRGRQQMALHIMRHLDIDAVRLMELQNEAHTQANNINEDY